MTPFNKLGLNPEIEVAIHELGFVKPTPIQEQCIPHILSSNQDLIALAQTGTGKTAAFGLPLLQQVDAEMQRPQLLILSPTRELAMQIASDLKTYAKYCDDLKIVAVYGGSDIRKQIKALDSGAQIVVGTPGRTLDLINRKKLRLNKISSLVLDEADEMLSMGFKEELTEILANTPKEKRVLLFSATMPNEIMHISKKYMVDPHEISVGKKNSGATNVEHFYYLIHAKDRYIALKRVADMNPNIYAIIFCRTRAETKDVAEKFMQDGYNADALHGDLSQVQRDLVMQRFRNKHLQMLVATDVAARGLDVNDLTHVINYNLPDDPEIYIHRSGRTGRAGKKGISLSFIHLREKGKMRQVEKKLGKTFQKAMVPTGTEVCEKQLFNLIDRVEKVETHDEQIDQYMPVIYKKLAWLEREELIKHFVSVEFNRFLSYYENAPDINAQDSKKNSSDYENEDRSWKKKKSKYSSKKGLQLTRMFLNIGKNSGMNKRKVIDIVNKNLSRQSVEIGDIDVMKSFSFFEIDSRFSKELVKAAKNKKFNGHRIAIDFAQ